MSLRVLTAAELPDLRRDPVDATTLATAQTILEEVRAEGEVALRRVSERFGDLEPGAPLILEASRLKAAYDALPADQQGVLERTAERIRQFALAQRDSLGPAQVLLAGGRAYQDVSPVERAAGYAPGGRYPLPSSVLMTAVTARAAGVPTVWVASPKPQPITLAAAHVAGADALLAVGGAQAVAALAYGAGPVPAFDAIVGPGNRFVTAAKQLVSGRVKIDMLAGPSELVVLADETADPEVIAADLLGQAEHDVDARPYLVSPSRPLIDAVNAALLRQLGTLPTREVAEAAVAGGFALHASDLEAAVAATNQLAPEHLELMVRDPASVTPRLRHYGGLFVGRGSAEVLGDYGAGPNHVLPTGGTARFSGGLSVFHFLRVRTVLELEADAVDPALVDDTVALARLEGLEAHARSAALRKRGP